MSNNGTEGGATRSADSAPLAAGVYAYRASIAGNANYIGATGVCEPFTVTTITINKLANGGDDTFGYTISGPSALTPSVTTTSGVGSVTVVVLSGTYTIAETTIPSGWLLVAQTCTGSFNVSNGTNQACNFENTKEGKTRTQGFWATHTAFASSKWASVPGSEQTLCGTKTITAASGSGNNKLMGAFWANIVKTSTGANRSNLDKARMGLLQQLAAAMLNRYGLGGADGGLIASAKAAYCGTNVTAIRTATDALSAWNQSGETIPLGFPVPAATPQTSRSEANLAFWDTTQ